MTLFTPKTIKEIIDTVNTSIFPLSTLSISKGINSEKLSPDDVRRVIDVLEKLPYIEVVKHPESGSIRRIKFITKSEGTFSMIEEDGHVSYFSGKKIIRLVSLMSEILDTNERNELTLKEVKQLAEERRRPFIVDDCMTNSGNVAPYIAHQLNQEK